MKNNTSVEKMSMADTIRTIRLKSGTLTRFEIAKLTGRTPISIKGIATRKKISLKTTPPYSEKDNQFIKDNVEKLSFHDIASELGRPPDAVRKHAKLIGITGERKALKRSLKKTGDSYNKTWTKKQDEELIAGIKNGISYIDIAKITCRTAESTRSRFALLKTYFFKHYNEEFDKTKSDHLVNITSIEIQPGALSSTWSSKEDKSLLQGILKGLPYITIADSLGRPKESVRMRFRKLTSVFTEHTGRPFNKLNASDNAELIKLL